MGEKDITEKLLEDYNDVFADIVNAIIFNGEQRVKPESLQNSSVHSQYKADEKIHEQERDVAKYWSDCNVEIALYGLENQSAVDNAMPLRIMGYDGAAYRSQVLRNRKSFIPVVTLVLYFGTEHPWNDPISLKDVVKIPDGMGDFVNDYKIHVVNVAWLTDEEIERFRSDFKLVARFFVEKRKNSDWMRNNRQEIRHVDEMLKLLSVMTKDASYEMVLAQGKEKEVMRMCDVAERLKIEGGDQKELELTINMIKKGLPEETILSFGISKKQLEKAKDLLLVKR